MRHSEGIIAEIVLPFDDDEDGGKIYYNIAKRAAVVAAKTINYSIIMSMCSLCDDGGGA